MLALHAPFAGAQVLVHLNDGLDDGCGSYQEITATLIIDPICSVVSVADMRRLGAGTGGVVINRAGAFINGGLAIGGSFDVGANQIHALQAGTAITDAVNLSQLTPVLNALGGGAGLDAATGAVSGPAFDLSNGGRQFTVGGALGVLDDAVGINKGGIAALQKLVSQDAVDGKIMLGSALAGVSVDISGKSEGSAQTRQLTGLTEGALSSISTDAVTGAQLHATNRDVAANTGNLSVLQTQIHQGGIGLLRQDPATQAITMAGDTGGGRINVAGTAGERVLGGLGNGTNDHDAVSVAQLKAVGLVAPDGRALAALVYDDLSLAGATLGGSAGTVIRNLANGAVALSSMEAINGGQLYEVQQKATQGIELLNGRVDTLYLRMDAYHPVFEEKPTGKGEEGKPAISPGATPDRTTAGAGATASGADSTALGAHSTASGNGSVAVGANSVADRDHTVSVGSPGGERQITNVATGTARTDAANWGQVQDALQEVQHWVRDRFRQASRLANAGTAAALAMTNLPQAYAPNQSAVGAGIGSFKGQSALAVGLSTITPDGRWVVKGSLTGNTQGDVGMGMGAAMVW